MVRLVLLSTFCLHSSVFFSPTTLSNRFTILKDDAIETRLFGDSIVRGQLEVNCGTSLTKRITPLMPDGHGVEISQQLYETTYYKVLQVNALTNPSRVTVKQT